MNEFLLARFMIGFIVVLGGVLNLGFWYLSYRRILPKLTQEHVPSTKHRHVRNLVVLIGFESTLQFLGWGIAAYNIPLIPLGGPESLTRLIVTEASLGVAIITLIAVPLTSGHLRQTLTSLEQPQS